MTTPRALECSICLQGLINPVKLPCGHSFCFLCVKGVANINRTCALCRKPFPQEFIDKPTVLATDVRDDHMSLSSPRHVWYYEGRNGWWLYDQRTNDEIDLAFRRGERRVEILIVGQLYVIDFENMQQFRLNETQRRRRIKYDLLSAPKKGVAGLKLDRQRSNPVEPPIVPSLASSVASVVVTSSSSDTIRRSRSNADGEDPTLVPPPPPTSDDSSRTIVRQPADGFGNPNSNRWRTTDEREDEEEEEEDVGPPTSRLRPVLIGGEDDRTSTRLSSDDTVNLFNNLSLS